MNEKRDVLEEMKIEKVDLVKIDVEGAELEVLKGLERTLYNLTLRKSVPTSSLIEEVN